MKYEHRYSEELEKVLKIACKNPKLLHEFLFDLLSPVEYKELAVRWQIMKMLWQKVPQREIAKKLHVSVATVTRGSRELANKKGGFRMMLEK
jgi:Trp operon repressor